MTTAARALPALSALLAIACTCAPDRPARPAAREAPAPETPETPEAAEAPPPPPAPEPREVSFETEDGVRIEATLRPPRAEEEPVVILVHQLGSTRAEWAPLIERLDREPRIPSLAIDLRGHGASTDGPGDGALDFHAFERAEWAATQEDVLAAVRWLSGPEAPAAPGRILAIGSSIGATAVIAAAAREPRILGIVAISPGRAYHGFDGLTPAMALSGRPILPIVAAEDLDGVETARALGRIGENEAIEIAGADHGVALLASEGTMDRVEAFLRDAIAR